MNEITVKLKCSISEIKEILKNRNFDIKNSYILDDTYYIPQDIDIDKFDIRDILNKAILLRDIEEHFSNKEIRKSTKLTFKQKQFALNGDILNQEKVDCGVTNKEDAKRFIEVIGYKRLMNIRENGTIFTNGELEIDVKDIINGEDLIEIEIVENNEKLNTIDKLKEKINKLEIPIDTSNYFVKKAEVELTKLLK